MESRIHKLWWQSSYDRGLDLLLFMWPDILSVYPDAELHIAYGWDLFDIANHNNPERMKWKEYVSTLMDQQGIVHYGRIGQDELRKHRKACGIWAYPTYFEEINCIGALEAQSDGLVPVVINDFALKETVGSGVKVNGNIRTLEVQEKYTQELIALMGDSKRWHEESEKAIQFAKNYKWELVSKEWVKEFETPIYQPLVSVITVTIREGFWNIMASNLASQTYKNFEWIIVDDYKGDRSDIAKKYAKKYGLNIRYIRGDKHTKEYKRRYGLVRANNIGYKASKGDLLVYLQDFIIIPNNGIESLVTVHRKHPTTLIAPVDEYYHCIKPNMANKVDWWDGHTDIIDRFSWRNVRVQFAGMRYTENPFDFEMNYAAIPRVVLDVLNGWWEFFDDGLGYDNTEIAMRALQSGYNIIIDDTNIATCIDLWPHIGGTKENIEGRERNLSTPYYVWLLDHMKDGSLSAVRDESLDKKIHLSFEVPNNIADKDAHMWINDNAQSIASKWKLP